MSSRKSKTALIVGGSVAQNARLEKALTAHGQIVSGCPGPTSIQCPALTGRPCSLRELSDVAIVFVDPDGAFGGTGVIPRLACAVHQASPGVIALEGSSSGPSIVNGHGVVGARMDEEAIAGLSLALVAKCDDATA